MSRLASCYLLLLLLNSWAGNELSARQAPPAGTPETQGEWLAHKIQDRDRGRDVRMAMRMRLFDRQNRIRERALTLIGLRGGPGRPAPGDRMLIRFTYPNDIAGTGFLVWQQPSGDDERFLYPPVAWTRATHRGRGDTGELRRQRLHLRGHRRSRNRGLPIQRSLPPAPPENGTWTSPDGSRQAVYRLESTNRDPAARFPRVVSLVRQDNFVVVHAEIHNKRDENQKVFTVNAARVARQLLDDHEHDDGGRRRARAARIWRSSRSNTTPA